MKNKKINKLKLENERLWTYIKHIPTTGYFWFKRGNKKKIELELIKLLENFPLYEGVTIYQEEKKFLDDSKYMKFEYAKLQDGDIKAIIEYIMEILINNAVDCFKEEKWNQKIILIYHLS